MKKVLFLATYGDFLATFEFSNITLWQLLGATVHCASNFKDKKYNLKTNRLKEINVIRHELEFDRKPFSLKNLRAFGKLKKIIRDEKIDIIDCHNAVVGAYARIAAKQCGVKTVIYTPHGFFFYKGSPRKNRVFKIIESNLSRITDLLITINKEDYVAAQRMPLRGKALYVPGIGIDTKAIMKIPNNRIKYCKELNIPVDAQIYISVGELIPRKDHITAIKAFAEANLKNAYYIIAGIGTLKDQLQKLIEDLGMTGKIKLLGYRLDVKELVKSCDVFLFPSKQEGLPVALMEAMACGLPCIASNIRGNVDLIVEKSGGYLFPSGNVPNLSKQIIKISNQSEKARNIMGLYNQKKIISFDISNVRKIMLTQYSELINK